MFYKAETTEREARQALLDAAQLLGFEGPGLYQSSDNYKGLICSPAKYIDLVKRTAEIGEAKPDGVFLKRLNHSTGFIGVECARCEAEPIGVKHSDYCDDCWSLEEKPKKGWVVFSGKVKDLASADLSGGWRGPGTYRLIPVGGVPKSKKKETLYRVETLADLSDLLRNSTACGVEKVEVEEAEVSA
jgi:hypothetical protein